MKINQPAPDFTLPSTKGSDFKLSDQLSDPLVLYFYPKDFTPGCTAEACEFRDHFEDFKGLNVKVVGISRDTVKTHIKFKQKHNLPFELLSDTTGKTAKLYNALIPVIGVPKRISFLIDSEGIIIAKFESLFGAKKHIKMMLEKLTHKSDVSGC